MRVWGLLGHHKDNLTMNDRDRQQGFEQRKRRDDRGYKRQDLEFEMRFRRGWKLPFALTMSHPQSSPGLTLSSHRNIARATGVFQL